jgi:hypothetical protein
MDQEGLRMPFCNLDKWIAQFAGAAVRTQEIFDRAWQQDMDGFQTTVANAPEEHREWLQPLAPCRQLLRQFEFELSVVFSVRSLKGFKIQLLPLNLSYSVTRQVRHENHGRVRLSVEQIPIQEEK